MVNVNVIAGIWGRNEQNSDVRSGRLVRLEKLRDNMVSSGGRLGLSDELLLATGGKAYFRELMTGKESRESFEAVYDILKMSQEGSKVREVFTGLMMNQLDFLENSITGGQSVLNGRLPIESHKAAHGVLLLHKQGNYKQKEAVRELVSRNIKRFVELSGDDEPTECRFLAHCSERSLETDGAVYRDILSSSDNLTNKDMASVVEGMFENIKYQSPGEVKKNLKMIMDAMVFRNYLGFRDNSKERAIVDDIVNSWMTVNYKDPEIFDHKFNGWPSPIHGFLINLITARCLVSDKGGKQCLFGLYKRFGITHFGRYGAEFLSRQWNDRDNEAQGITGVFLGSYGDWNGAFYKRRGEFVSFEDSVRKVGRRLVVVEARDKLAIARRLLSVSGRSGLIDFMIVAAHGDPRQMTFGRGYREADYVDIQDTLNKTTEKIATRSYRRGMPILFQSCSVGELNGIAHHFAYRLNTSAIGPDKPSHIESYRLELDETGMSRFSDVVYNSSEPMEYSFG